MKKKLSPGFADLQIPKKSLIQLTGGTGGSGGSNEGGEEEGPGLMYPDPLDPKKSQSSLHIG
jgi:hypothetical protein